ncbi:hypothetical protein [Streptomyces sirii]|uniref:hypothetical protein n=1 Tax=Streptomyces sirii TaxID=3127701 RepID=UPI003D360834
MLAILEQLAAGAPAIMLAVLLVFAVIFLAALAMCLWKTTPSERPAILEALATLMKFWRR